MKFQKVIARKVVFPIAMAVGIDKLIRKKAGNAIINVMYHGVVSADSTYFSPRHIEKKQFERQLQYFKKNFEILSIPDAFQKISGQGKLEKKYLTISFDDGFQNNLTTVLPLLEKYGIPATIFVSGICTRNDGAKYLWAELIAALKYFYKNEPVEIHGQTFTNLVEQQTNKYLPDLIKALSYDERDGVLEFIEQKFDLGSRIKSLPAEIWKLLNKEELIALSESPVITIGSHGYNHFNLGQIDVKTAEEELRTSKTELEKAIGKNVDLIAYPDGSYNTEVKNIAQNLGYTGQLAVQYRSPEDVDDVRMMNRHGISATTTFESTMLLLNQAFNMKAIQQN